MRSSVISRVQGPKPFLVLALVELFYCYKFYLLQTCVLLAFYQRNVLLIHLKCFFKL